MTDDRMHARLQQAGERWRRAQEPTAVDHPADEVPLQIPAICGRFSRRPTTLLSAAAVAIAALAAGIWLVARPSGPSQSAAAARLAGTDWVLVEVAGRHPAAAPGGVPAHLRGKVRLAIKGGHIVGNDGCNTFSGKVAVHAGTLRIGDLATTAMACLGRAQLAIGSYFTGSLRWSISADTLTLTKDGVGTLTYQAPAPGSPEELVDRTWVLQGFLGAATDFGSSGTTPAPPTTAPRLHPLTGSTLFIDTDGNLTATDRCGQFTARVQVFAAKLTIRDRVVSDHSCPAPVGGATDAAALTRRALTGTVAWRIDGDVLEIGPTQGPVLQYGVQTAEPAPSRTGTASAASGLGVPVTGSASPAAGVTLFDRTWYLSALRRATLVGAAGSQPEVQPGDPRRTPTFRIDQHGEFVARSQCFAFVGRAAISPTVLTTHSRSSKALPCSGAIGRQRLVDRLIGRLFAGAVDWRVSGSTLVLTSGRGTAEYTAQPPIPSTGNASTGGSIGGATAAPSK